MDDTNDKPPIATRVITLQEAVQLSLKDGLTENCLFVFARALLAFEATTGIKLQPPDLKSAFTLWWSTAKPLLPADADFEVWRYVFEDARATARCPLGTNALAEAIRRTDTEPLPPQEAKRCTSPKIRRLLAVCYYLQILAGDNPFFISVREAAKILGTKNLHQANAMLAGLVRDEILIEVEKGTRGGRRATRFRFNLSGSAPAKETGSPASAKATARTAPDQPKPRAKPGNTPAQRPPTTYELAERKKALQDLIKGFGHQNDYDYWSQGEQEQYTRLQAELKQVNSLLAGIGE